VLYDIFKCCTDLGTLTVQPDGRVIHIENGTMQTICSYEWDDVDAGVLCRHLGMGMSGRATHLPRDINHDCQTKHKIWHIFVSSVLM
jgi:hypothetical protein